jgi:hypothetical protein
LARPAPSSVRDPSDGLEERGARVRYSAREVAASAMGTLRALRNDGRDAGESGQTVAPGRPGPVGWNHRREPRQPGPAITRRPAFRRRTASEGRARRRCRARHAEREPPERRRSSVRRGPARHAGGPGPRLAPIVLDTRTLSYRLRRSFTTQGRRRAPPAPRGRRDFAPRPSPGRAPGLRRRSGARPTRRCDGRQRRS